MSSDPSQSDNSSNRRAPLSSISLKIFENSETDEIAAVTSALGLSDDEVKALAAWRPSDTGQNDTDVLRIDAPRFRGPSKTA